MSAAGRTKESTAAADDQDESSRRQSAATTNHWQRGLASLGGGHTQRGFRAKETEVLVSVIGRAVSLSCQAVQCESHMSRCQSTFSENPSTYTNENTPAHASHGRVTSENEYPGVSNTTGRKYGT